MNLVQAMFQRMFIVFLVLGLAVLAKVGAVHGARRTARIAR